MNTRTFLFSVAVAGAAIAILSSIPILNLVNCLFCAWAWTGGISGVWLYMKQVPSKIDLGQGAGIGLATGVFASFLIFIFGLVFSGIGLAGLFESDAANDLLGSFALSSILATIGLWLNLIFYPIFGLIGGIIGASIFKN